MNLITMDDQDVLDRYMSEVEDVKNGNAGALDVGTRLYELQKSLESLYDELKDHIYQAREKYHDKEDVVRNGYRVSITRRKYYSYSQDPEWNMINERKKTRERLMKKAAKLGRPITDSETGESVDPAPFKERSYPKMEYVGDQYGSI